MPKQNNLTISFNKCSHFTATSPSLTKRLLSASKPLVGRNLIKGGIKSSGCALSFCLYTFWLTYKVESLLLGKKKHAKVKCQKSSLFWLIPKFIALRKRRCLEAESSYYTVGLLHSRWQQRHIFLDWLWILFALVVLFVSPGNLRATDNQSNCSSWRQTVEHREKINLTQKLNTQYKFKRAKSIKSALRHLI